MFLGWRIRQANHKLIQKMQCIWITGIDRSWAGGFWKKWFPQEFFESNGNQICSRYIRMWPMAHGIAIMLQECRLWALHLMIAWQIKADQGIRVKCTANVIQESRYLFGCNWDTTVIYLCMVRMRRDHLFLLLGRFSRLFHQASIFTIMDQSRYQW